MAQDSARLKTTPLHEEHVRLNAKLVPFGGFAMPVQYPTGIRAEHEAVRSAAGLFDVSHMGEFRVAGPQAVDLVSYVTTNDPAALSVGQAQYSAMCLESGGIVDDLIVYRLAADTYRLVVNAANIAKDWSHISLFAGRFDAELRDESEQIALLALQGPESQAVLSGLTDCDLDAIRFYWFAEGEVAGIPTLISRTGYTGEDGFELYVDAGGAAALWRALLDQERRVTPAGLGARDTLRLEMGYALYGSDIDEETTPLEGRLGWLVKPAKGDFVGREAIEAQRSAGLRKRLTGIRLTERGFPRPGYDVVFRGEPAVAVRSGTVGPSVGYGIATAYLPPDASPGDPAAIVIRGREVGAEVTSMPFYTEGSLRR
ncbi:MAG: glycine cleavage system aminomethyltransferase GcvT [Gemmatimonadota bacterium]|jgi:aminomethyltransferase|nr:MAG: glycine cleavage system aminomethyltransferase GcvT [Gemmatimonadota bacterium]